MLIKLIIKLLYISLIALFSCVVSADDSIVGLALNKEVCVGDEVPNFLPMPTLESKYSDFKFLNSFIDIKFSKDCKLSGLLLSGEINKNTFKQFKLAYKLLEARREQDGVFGNTVWIDSKGGLITEAIKIGDFIGEKQMGSLIAFRGHCFSSCVLIYAASETRGGIGDVGIHRPFASEIDADSLSYAEYLKKYEAITPVLKSFFSKYGVSPSIVDAMNSIPSDEIRILSKEEQEEYGLGYMNVAAKEHEKARTIQICGQDYHSLYLKFNAFIDSCAERFGIDILDEKYQGCVDLARQAFPDYSEKFDECKTKKANKKGL